MTRETRVTSSDDGGAGLWDEGWVELSRTDGVNGEVLLRRRQAEAGPLVELVCGGVMVMDDADTTTERQLATAALAVLDDPPPGSGWRVLVGGLGLGFTLAQVLADGRVAEAVVAELEPAVVDLVRRGLVPTTRGVLDDPRARVEVGDVADALAGASGLDAVLLDVDNGPAFLVAPTNDRLYSPEGLAVAAGALRPGGVLVVWCAHEPGELAATARAVPALERVEVVHSPVVREGRELGYWLVVARRSGLGRSGHGADAGHR